MSTIQREHVADISTSRKHRVIPAHLCLLLISLSWATTALAQPDSYEFRVTDATAPLGSLFVQEVTFETNTSSVLGWSFGVCHDPLMQTPCGAQMTEFVFEINQIGPPFFYAVNLVSPAAPGLSDGVAHGVLIETGGLMSFTYPPDTLETILEIEYLSLADSGTASTFLCDTVDPSFEVAVVNLGGGLILPSDPTLAITPGVTTFAPAQPQWHFTGAVEDVVFHSTLGTCNGASCTASVELTIANALPNLPYPDTAGFSMSLSHDPSLLTPISVEVGPLLAALEQSLPIGPGNFTCNPGGALGPDIVLTQLSSQGVSVHVQNTELPAFRVFPYCLQPIDWGTSGALALTVDYAVNSSALVGQSGEMTTPLVWEDIGDNVGNGVVLNCWGDNLIELVAPTAVSTADIELTLVSGARYLRSDCNQDGAFNIADLIWMIGGYLATPPLNPAGSCESACDFNADATIDVSDVPYAIAYQFLGGPPPPAPFPSCDTDPDAECDAYLACP